MFYNKDTPSPTITFNNDTASVAIISENVKSFVIDIYPYNIFFTNIIAIKTMASIPTIVLQRLRFSFPP